AAFEQAMDDDFNTPVALAEFQRLRGELNTKLQSGVSAKARNEARDAFRRFGQVLGLFQVPVKEWEFRPMITGTVSEVQSAQTEEGAGIVKSPVTEDEIERLIAERNEARSKKDFARADGIRKELAAQGIILEDRPDGTTRWKR
ncbi:MAG: DALR domain-containing protein, partial [Nitrospirota bacterium]